MIAPPATLPRLAGLRLGDRWADSWRAAALLLAALLLAVVAASLAGVWRSAEAALEQASFALLDRPASGQVHIVEMDAASIAAIQRWPWPRDHYARAVAKLDAAGVRSIAFDVDFSNPGDPAGDRAFAAAIAAARTPGGAGDLRPGRRGGRQAPARCPAHRPLARTCPSRLGLGRAQW